MEKGNGQSVMINVWIKGEGPLMTVRNAIPIGESPLQSLVYFVRILIFYLLTPKGYKIYRYFSNAIFARIRNG